MVIITKAKIINFYTTDTKAKEPLLRWHNEVLLCDWQDFHSIKQVFNSVDNIGNDRFVFNIGGNKYRIVAMIHFSIRTIYIRFVGTLKNMIKLTVKLYKQ